MTTYFFSAPGRTEIGGNHTDHQNGCILAAAVTQETVAEVQLLDLPVIRIQSEGYAPIEIDLSDLACREEEKNTSAALVRGIAAALKERGANLKGFLAKVKSTVLPGSGLSSSAAFEILVGTILNELFLDGKLTPLQIAQIGQWAEKNYFGKPCGLMDQAVSCIGGMVFIDFKDPSLPGVKKIDFDFEKTGFSICLVDCGADHANLTQEYAAVPQELKSVCALFGKEVLREIPKEEFFRRLPSLRGKVPDRAILRAIHFYGENERVQKQLAALETGDFDTFLSLVSESGRSSFMYLQNIIPTGEIKNQDLAIALAMCDTLLQGKGAFRVHGGGFAGTVQAFVPKEMLEEFRAKMEEVLGSGCVHEISIRNEGGKRLR